MLFVTNCATGWRDHLILQTKILDAKCGTFFLLQLCLHLSPLAREKTSFFQWLFKWILLLVCMNLFSIDKNLHRKKLNPFTLNTSCIRPRVVSQSHAHRVKKKANKWQNMRRAQGRERKKSAYFSFSGVSAFVPQTVFRQGGSAPSFYSNPLFSSESTPFVYLLLKNGTLPHNLFRTLRPFQPFANTLFLRYE